MAMHRGIVTVTLNPSIDVTLWLDGLDPDRVNRVEDEARQAGGKGINVSRVVRSFGLDSLCLAVAGSDNSREFARFLEDDGLRYEMLHVEGAVRENLTLRTGGQTVKLNRRGPSMTTMMIGALMALIRSHVRPGDIVVFAGSLPEHVDIQDNAELILAVKNAGALVAVDSDELRLEDYRMIRPWLIKPNLHEARHILEVKDDSPAAVAEAARKLREIGVENAMISMGGGGLLCACEEGVAHAAAPQVEVKSTVGAGDSALAGFIVGFVKGWGLQECVRMAAACGTAAAAQDGTTVATKESAGALLDGVKVTLL